MKSDVNGVSQCQKGTENYETFYTTIRRKRTKLIQYDYRNEDGELFTCVKPTLTECRKARDEHFKPVVVVYTPEQFKELGFDGEIAKYMQEHTNTAIVGDVPGLTATLSVIGRIRIGQITVITTPIQKVNNPPGVRPRYNNNDMITKAEIMETAALKIDLSTFPAEALEKMNEMFNGDYAGAMAETDAAIERGVDLFLSAVGRPVEVWSDGKAKATAVARIDYDPKDDYYILEFRDKGRFMFRNGGFSSLGHTGEFYGIVNDPEKKSGIKFINYKPGE